MGHTRDSNGTRIKVGAKQVIFAVIQLIGRSRVSAASVYRGRGGRSRARRFMREFFELPARAGRAVCGAGSVHMDGRVRIASW
jgi:hypothetical protein